MEEQVYSLNKSTIIWNKSYFFINRYSMKTSFPSSLFETHLNILEWSAYCIIISVDTANYQRPTKHCEKYRNFTQFPVIEILWKDTISANELIIN